MLIYNFPPFSATVKQVRPSQGDSKVKIARKSSPSSRLSKFSPLRSASLPALIQADHVPVAHDRFLQGFLPPSLALSFHAESGPPMDSYGFMSVWGDIPVVLLVGITLRSSLRLVVVAPRPLVSLGSRRKIPSLGLWWPKRLRRPVKLRSANYVRQPMHYTKRDDNSHITIEVNARLAQSDRASDS